MALIGTAVAQTEFSGEAVNQNQNHKNQEPAKIFAGKDKIRFEAADRGGAGPSVVIVDLTAHMATVLMAKQNMYMEVPQQFTEQRGLYSFFKSGDPENACADWLKMRHAEDATCHKVGHESVNGRDAVKYEGANSSGETTSVWIDPKLRIPVKWQGKDSGGEVRNIKEGPQPASLFEIPSGYTKMDVGAMMQQRQQR